MLENVTCVSTVYTALNAFLAEKLIKENCIDIILLDINMPGKTGVEYLKEVKKDNPQIIVLMVTNQDADYYRHVCLGLGADFFIDKSNEFEKIPEIIQSFCKDVTA